MQGLEEGKPEIVKQSQMGGISSSGGGFSTHFTRPTYQNNAVEAYFSRVTPYPGYAASGRGYPDLAVAAVGYLVDIGGTTLIFGGTSTSTPVVAGIISLVNAARLRVGLSPVGWFHPILYNYNTLFTRDVTSGNNSCTCCGPNPVCCSQGFAATRGWDPVSGFGSIDVRLLLQFMMNVTRWTLPTDSPTRKPTMDPTFIPTRAPSTFKLPTNRPTAAPTIPPTITPTIAKASLPTRLPTQSPQMLPTRLRTNVPSSSPSASPTATPSSKPSPLPTRNPSGIQSVSPTATPSMTPTAVPSSCPSASPTAPPSGMPSVSPTATPSMTPTAVPSSCPSASPTAPPSVKPLRHSRHVDRRPTFFPTSIPSRGPIHLDFPLSSSPSSKALSASPLKRSRPMPSAIH